MAAPSGNYYGRWIDFERLADDFDYIGFMTYDYHGTWSDHSGPQLAALRLGERRLRLAR